MRKYNPTHHFPSSMVIWHFGGLAVIPARLKQYIRDTVNVAIIQSRILPHRNFHVN